MKSKVEWVAIPGYTGYEISPTGSVRSFWRRTGPPGSTFNKWKWEITDDPKVIGYSINRDGYHMIRLQKEPGRQMLVTLHKLMLESFVGPRPAPNYHACHIDDDKDRNMLSNLEWNTKEKNLQGRFINHGGEKLDKSDIEKIREFKKMGLTQTCIAKKFNVTQSLISRIISRECWHYV